MFKYKILTGLVCLTYLFWAGSVNAEGFSLEERVQDPDQWVMQNGDFGAGRYSELSDINTSNAANLKLVWSFDTQTPRGHEGAPLVVKDVPMGDGTTKNLMFLVTPYPNRVFALDLDAEDPGAEAFWALTPDENNGGMDLDPVPLGGPYVSEGGPITEAGPPPGGYGKVTSGLYRIVCCDVVNRGVAYAQPDADTAFLFITQIDGRLTKINAATGEIIERVNLHVDKDTGEALALGSVVTSAPHVFKDKIIVGMSGGEYGVQGYIDAYGFDLKRPDGSNNIIWRGYSTGPDKYLLVNTSSYDTVPNQPKTLVMGKVIAPGTGVTFDVDTKEEDVTPYSTKSPFGTWVPITITNPHLNPDEDPVLVGDPEEPDSFEYSNQWKNGGGATWGYVSYDPELNLIYYGTGNPSTWNPANRPGDNKWSTAVIARDLDTGAVRWMYQMTPHDEWDYDGNMEVLLRELNNKKVAVHFGRNGFAYVLDAETGDLIKADPFHLTNWTTRIDMNTGRPFFVNRHGKNTEVNPAKSTETVFANQNLPEGEKVVASSKRICPTAKGPRDVLPGSYSPKTGLHYHIKGKICMDYLPRFIVYHEGSAYVGADVDMYAYDNRDESKREEFPIPKDPIFASAEDGSYAKFDNDGNLISNPRRVPKGEFIGFDIQTGHIRFTIQETQQGWAGTLATAGDLVFYGTLDGYFKVVDATNGEVLKTFEPEKFPVGHPNVGETNPNGVIKSGIVGNPMTFRIDGKQYVAIMVNIGGWAGLPVVDPYLDLANPQSALGVTGMNSELQQQWGAPPSVDADDPNPDDARTGRVMVFALDE